MPPAIHLLPAPCVSDACTPSSVTPPSVHTAHRLGAATRPSGCPLTSSVMPPGLGRHTRPAHILTRPRLGAGPLVPQAVHTLPRQHPGQLHHQSGPHSGHVHLEASPGVHHQALAAVALLVRPGAVARVARVGVLTERLVLQAGGGGAVGQDSVVGRRGCCVLVCCVLRCTVLLAARWQQHVAPKLCSKCSTQGTYVMFTQRSPSAGSMLKSRSSQHSHQRPCHPPSASTQSGGCSPCSAWCCSTAG